MTYHELEDRCLKVIAEATTRMQEAPGVEMREKWQSIREIWIALLKKAQDGTLEPGKTQSSGHQGKRPAA
jgi:hypothetical protein